jgi:membrane fusion protein, multidrug efflux system
MTFTAPLAGEARLEPSPTTPPMPSSTKPSAPPPGPAQPRRRIAPLAIGFVLAVLAPTIAFAWFYLPGFYAVETDDAQVDAHVFSIASKIAAYVAAVNFDDNARVQPGSVLIGLDPRSFEIAVSSATADLGSAEANAANIEAQIAEQQSVIAQADASIVSDQAAVKFAKDDYGRFEKMTAGHITSVQDAQRAQTVLQQQTAQLQRDRAAQDAARAHVAVLETGLRQAQAAIDRARAVLAQARLDLSYTKIYAASAGSVADRKVEVGDYVQPGQVLVSVVPDTLYVTANYKESQLTDVKPGQRVTISIDAFPSVRLTGHVDSLQRGTGSHFALLPPENATGNFVKVVQRVPVKILFDDPPERLRGLAPGMSVETRIDIADPPSWLSFLN